MKKRKSLWVLMFLALALGVGRGQNDKGQQPADNNQQPGTAPAPAFGQDNAQPQSSDNPPISGLDQPSLEPRASARSYLIPGAHVSEAVDSNVTNGANSPSINSVTRALGSLTLKKLRRRYDVALDYVGGGAFYYKRGTQLHQLDADQRFLWRTGQLAIRDSFSYLPEGSFGYGSFGGAGALSGMGGVVGGGISNNFFGPGQFATLGQHPRISNVAIADITESLNPRSSVTLAGSYGLVHFINNLGSSPGTPAPSISINSRQVSGQAGYSYQLNRKDQIGLVYGYQDFRYPSSIGSSVNTNLVNAMYGHRISGRLDLVLGGGPQLTQIHNPLLGSSRRLSASGRASLRYRFPKTSVGLSYDHFNSNGSGLFVGASSDVARLDATRPIGRVWSGIANLGFTHNNRLVPNPLGIGVTALSYAYLYAGGGVRRQLGRDFGLSISYQFNNLGFDSSFCGPTAPCSRTSQRHVATVVLNWHPRPIRLD